MQLLFLFCTMLIVISEAFSQRLTVAPRSTSFKRKTSRFSHRLRNPVTRYMYSDLNVPLNLVPFNYEISQYKAPKFAPQNRHGTRLPKCKRKYFHGESNVKERLRRHFLKNNLKFSAESIFNSPQSFESYQFPRSGYRHFRNFMGLRKYRDSKTLKKLYNRKKRKHQCLRRVHAPFYRKNRSLGMRKLIKKHKRFSNFKRQCLSDVDIETKSGNLKPNVTDISRSEEEVKTKSDDSVGEKFEDESPQDFSVYAKSNATTEKTSLPVSSNVQKFEQPDDPKQYLSSFENNNLAPSAGKEEIGEEVGKPERYRNSLEGNLTQDISKLKHMIFDVEKALKEWQEGSFAEPEHPQDKKKNDKEKGASDNKTTTVSPDSKSNNTSTEASKKGSKKSKKDESLTEAETTAVNNLTERCSPDGTWSSTTMRMNLTFTMQPNLMIKVKIRPHDDSAINDKWSLQGLSLSKRGGPFIFAGLYPQKRAVVTFLGQCKISKEDDFIFGIWTLFHYSRKYTDLWKSIETKLDVLARQEMLEKKKHMKEKKKKEEKKT